MATFKNLFKILFPAVLAAAICALPAQTPAQTKKAPVEQLTEELHLTLDQVVALKHIFVEFTKKRKELAAREDAGAPPDEVVERQQRLQREFYEELARILSPEQIAGYKEFVRRGGPAESPAGGTDGDGLVKLPAVKASVPWIDGLRKAADRVEMSGLQKQAFQEVFREMESHASQLLYWDPGYKPAEDPELVSLLEVKLEWILTKGQRDEFSRALPGTGAEDAEE